MQLNLTLNQLDLIQETFEHYRATELEKSLYYETSADRRSERLKFKRLSERIKRAYVNQS